MSTISAAMLLTVTQASAASAETERATDTTGPGGSGYWYCVNYGNNSTGDMKAQACWMEEGDWFQIHDARGDGYSAVVDWQSIDPQNRIERWGAIFNANGNQSTVFKNKNFPEENSIRFRACLGNWSTKLIQAGKCSGWKKM
ncbi:hypothetical protein [Streptomyces sp. NPDC015350]|uniref:hypothetical protein n=1 Tax=Streptomyces sp. NPDC015350 TaxID=3364955 RepID=UPI0036F724C6